MIICIIGILDNELNKVDFVIILYSMCKIFSDWFIILNEEIFIGKLLMILDCIKF